MLGHAKSILSGGMDEVAVPAISAGSKLTSSQRTVDHLPFSVLATLYQDLRKAKVTGKKRTRGFHAKGQVDSRRAILTAAWMKIAEQCGFGGEILAKRLTDDHFVPAQLFPPRESFKLLCFLVPPLDSEHAYLGMKETKLADAFVKALDLVPHGDDAQWLKHHKEKEYRPQRWRQDADIVDGNFATVLKAVLNDRCPAESSLTLGIVWNALDALSKATRGRSTRIARMSNYGHKRDSEEKRTTFDSGWEDSTAESEDGRAVALRTLIQVGTAEEVAEVARIILKDVDIRLSEDMFLSWLHPGAKQHYTQIHDIHQLLKDCADPNFEVGEASVQVGQYASVMLCMRPSRKKLDTICENLRGIGAHAEGNISKTTETTRQSRYLENSQRRYFIMEPKLDGERLQLHKWRSHSGPGLEEYDIRTFSRKGNDSSAMYAGALRDVVLSAVNADNFILDGEIMIWDDLKASWLRFEDIREVATSIAKRKVPEGASYTLKYMVFDVLYVDQGQRKQGESRRSGNMVIRLPLHRRRMLMEKLILPKEVSYGIGARASIEVVGMERGHDERQLTQALQRYETLGYEGVIAKNPDMPYALAERSLDVAIKLKPDYFDGGIQDLDVLILGAKYSSSRGHRKQRAGQLSSFLIGVRAEEADSPIWKGHGEEWEQQMRKCKWIPVGNVGTGYSDIELAEIQNLLQGEWKPFDAKDLPDHFERRDYAPTLLSDIVKWVEPWKSIVLTIRAFEINRRFYALRFPRVERINWEKPYHDVPTFGHLLDLDENKPPATVRPDEADVDDVLGVGVKKKSRKAFDSDEEEVLERVKEEGHLITGGRNPRSVIASAVGADVSNIEIIASAFEGLTFYVIAPNSEPKERVEVKVYQLGGSFVQNFGSTVNFVICTSIHVAKVKLLKDRFSKTWGDDGTCPIIHSNWVDECLSRKSRILPSLNDVVYATDQLEEELFEKADRFGDSWTDDTTVETFSRSLEEVTRWKQNRLSDEKDVQSVEEIELDVRRAMKYCKNVFDGLVVLVPDTEIVLPGSVALLEAFGARIVTTDEAATTHVLVHSSSVPKWKQLYGTRNDAVVTEAWVRDCVTSGRIKSARNK